MHISEHLSDPELELIYLIRGKMCLRFTINDIIEEYPDLDLSESNIERLLNKLCIKGVCKAEYDGKFAFSAMI